MNMHSGSHETIRKNRTALGAGAALVLTFGLVLAACASATSSTSVGAIPPIAPTARRAVPARSPLWPRHPRVVATVRAPEPPTDDVLNPRFRSIFLAAYAEACSDLTSVREAILPLGPRSRLIDIRCGQEPVRAVRLVFTGVVVPDLRGQLAMNEPQTLLTKLGLQWHITRLAARAGEQPGTLLEQEPRAGTVVPFGTTITAVITR